jgi:hypothetical protein
MGGVSVAWSVAQGRRLRPSASRGSVRRVLRQVSGCATMPGGFSEIQISNFG